MGSRVVINRQYGSRPKGQDKQGAQFGLECGGSPSCCSRLSEALAFAAAARRSSDASAFPCSTLRLTPPGDAIGGAIRDTGRSISAAAYRLKPRFASTCVPSMLVRGAMREASKRIGIASIAAACGGAGALVRAK
jgi:hypothetical protein